MAAMVATQAGTVAGLVATAGTAGTVGTAATAGMVATVGTAATAGMVATAATVLEMALGTAPVRAEAGDLVPRRIPDPTAMTRISAGRRPAKPADGFYFSVR
jgi:hypothetical protein